jgi:hypothetical protein
VTQATQWYNVVAAQALKSGEALASLKYSGFASVLRGCAARTFAAVARFAPVIAQAAQKIFSCATGASISTQGCN